MEDTNRDLGVENNHRTIEPDYNSTHVKTRNPSQYGKISRKGTIDCYEMREHNLSSSSRLTGNLPRFDWEAGETCEQHKDSKKNRIMPCLTYGLPFWLYTILKVVLASMVILLPVGIICLVFNLSNDPKNHVTWIIAYNQDIDEMRPNMPFFMEFMRWSIVVASLVDNAIIAIFISQNIPNIMIYMTKILQISVSEKLKFRLEFVHALRKYISVVISVLFSLLEYTAIANDKFGIGNEYSGFYLNMLYYLESALACSAILLIEKAFIQLVAVEFHRVAYKDRVEKSNYRLMVLDKMKRAMIKYERFSSVPISAITTEDKEEPKHHKIHKKLMIIGETGLKALLKGTKIALNTTAQAFVTKDIMEINSSDEAKKLARLIHETVRSNESDGLLPEDFRKLFNNVEDAEQVFSVFDVDCSGDVTPEELKKVVVSIYKERKHLAKSLRDMSQCVGKLDHIFLAISAFFMAIAVGLLLRMPVFSYLALAGTVLLGMAFILGDTLKNLFECLIFLFILHPYDVGDKVIINQQTLVVKEIGILQSNFQKPNGEIVYVPHKQILTATIHNVRRSGHQFDEIVLNVDPGIPINSFHVVHGKMTEFLGLNGREFNPKCGISFGINDNGTIKVSFSVQHKSNFHDSQAYNERRNKCIQALFEFLVNENILVAATAQQIECKIIN